MNTTGERIKKRRKELGISADELAEAIGKDRTTIFRYESGAIEKMPSDVLVPIAKALKTTPAHLMGWDDENGWNDTIEVNDIYGINKQEMIDYLNRTNPELIETYKHIAENENLSLLFDAAKDLTPEDLAPILAIIQKIRKAKGIE